MTRLSWSSSLDRRSVNPADASSLVGHELFVTEWRTVDREHLDGFHWSVDEVVGQSDMDANAEFPRGDENIDGFMLVSLMTSAFFNNFPVGGEGFIAWNYGLDKVRFPATAYVGDRLRMRVTLSEVVTKEKGWLLSSHVVVDLEDSARPAMSGTFHVMMTSTAHSVQGAN